MKTSFLLRKKRSIVSFELLLLFCSFFAFSHALAEASQPIEEAVAERDVLRSDITLFEAIALYIVQSVKSPLVPRVSAQPVVGCCSLDTNDDICSVATPDTCKGEFAQDTLCDDTSFCRKGCCYNSDVGVFAQDTIKSLCPSSNKWSSDASCASVPGSKLGCCILNGKTQMVNERQCEIATKTLLGDGASMDWKPNFNLQQCRLAAVGDKMGACEIGGGDCVFSSARQCADNKGLFSEGHLCTSRVLNTSCEMTADTRCNGEKVHFVDSCGNLANIYDASRVSDQSYWDEIISDAQSCGSGRDDGNANSKDCGNCNKIDGGICKNAVVDGFEPTHGTNYCAPSQCTFKGQTYRDGESWCVYDGAIGDGDDVVGSRHWRYVCSQGSVQIEPCTDGRQQVCTQKNNPVPGKSYEFRESHCVVNNWRQCLSLNGGETAEDQKENIELCSETLHCRVAQVEIADQFHFDMCAPKYPAGVDFTDPVAQKFRESTCAAANQKCVVYRKPYTWKKGCRYVANENCLSESFGQEMNDLCRGLGDCGGEVNIVGKYTKNHKIRNAPKLSDSWIAKLAGLSNPVDGQYAEAEDYSRLEASLSAWGDPGAPKAPLYELNRVLGDLSLGGGAAGFVGIIAGSSTVGGFAGAISGAIIGFQLGLSLGESLGLTPGGAVLVAIGGAIIGATVGLYLTGAVTALTLPVVGWIVFIVIVIIIIVILIFGGSDCDPIEVEFTCKPWQPPRGGDDCSKCNDDPLKPCSKYRCESLGAACKFVNDFKHNGLCIHVDINDRTPPKITPNNGVISPSLAYTDVTDTGFGIIPIGGGCIDPRPTLFGVKTDEATKCKLSPNLTARFDDMDDFGTGLYSLNHSIRLPVPDPSHGKSMGINWTGDINLKVACQDTHGNENVGPFVIHACVNQGDDKFPTTIENTIPRSKSTVSFDKQSQDVTFMTYELATCKWDASPDKKYDAMAHEMLCNDTLFKPSSPQGYTCKTSLPLNGTSNSYYVKCKDQPWLAGTNDASKRNENPDDFVYELRRPEGKITIDSIVPHEDMTIKGPQAVFDLEVRTSNGGTFHFCKFSTRSYDTSVEMFVTGTSKKHTQQNVRAFPGSHNVFIECYDETDDTARNKTSFEVIRDTTYPVVSRVTQTAGSISFETQETATCKFDTKSCDFTWGDASTTGSGTAHTLSSKRGQTYYVRCEDQFGNKPSGCSIEIQAV